MNKCSACKLVAATIHLTEVVDGELTELHLCDACFKEDQRYANQMLTNLSLVVDQPDPREPSADPMVCEACGWTYQDLQNTGKLGCPSCYGIFHEPLTPIMKRLHHDTHHCGKVPQSAQANSSDLDALHDALKRAIETQDFEEAARLRDKIKEHHVA